MAINIHVGNVVQPQQRRRIKRFGLPGTAEAGDDDGFKPKTTEMIDDRPVELIAEVGRDGNFLDPHRLERNRMRLDGRDHGQADLFREIRGPLALEIEPFEKKRRRAADRDDIASDFLELYGDLLRALETFEKFILVAAPESDKGGNDLHPVGGVLVPEGE